MAPALFRQGSCQPLRASFVAPVLRSHQGDEVTRPGVTAQRWESFSGLITLRYSVMTPSVICSVSME